MPHPPQPSTGSAPSPLRVLLIADAPDDARLLVETLDSAGFAPTWEVVRDAEGMTEALTRREWDVALSADALSRFSALGALEVLKARGLDIPLLVVPGDTGEDRMVELMRAGAQDFVARDQLKRLAPAVDRELREAALRREHRRSEELVAHFGRVLDRTTNEIFVFDADSLQFLHANRAALRNLGYSLEELTDLTPADVNVGGSVAQLQRLLRPLREGREARTFVEGRLRRRDGSTYPARAWIELLREEVPPVFLAIITDSTEVERLEAQFHHAQKLEAVGRLAGGVAHDFNNLLMAITGHSELALRRLPNDAPASSNLREIVKAADRAAGLTRQLLAFSRREASVLTKVDLNAVVQDLEKMLRRLLGEDVTLEVDLQPGLGSARADPGQLEQVFLNLAVNARDAMPSGGRLTVRTRLAEFTKASADRPAELPPGDYLALSVGDTGTGMDASTMAHLFEPFFTTKEQGKGTGLGLATVYGIVRQAGGHVRVESQPGQGSTFTLFFPRDEKSGPPERAPTEAATPGRETLLVAEDEETVRDVLLDVLRGTGYRVLAASGVTEALGLFDEHADEVALLVTDVVLADGNGGDLYRELAARRPNLPVLFLSGYSDDRLRGLDLSRAGVTLLRKPFRSAELARQVRAALNGARKATPG